MVWLIVLPFFWFAEPALDTIAVGMALAGGGLWIRGWSAGTIHKNQVLTTTGPYAFTRNPLYLGSFFIGVGVSIAGGHWVWPTVFLVFFSVIYSRTMGHEAEKLAQLFPGRYAQYKAAVPGFLPRLTPYRDPDSIAGGGSFEWNQYRSHREWEAALGAAASFVLLAAKAAWF